MHEANGLGLLPGVKVLQGPMDTGVSSVMRTGFRVSIKPGEGQVDIVR